MTCDSLDNQIQIVTSEKLFPLLSSLQPKMVVFDIFDTLIYRRVHPEDVKRIASVRLGEYLANGTVVRWEKLYKYRQEIERKLCRENQSKGHDLEFSFDQFADRLFHVLSRGQFAFCLPDRHDFFTLLYDIELSVEKSIQYVDNQIKSIVSNLYDADIPIYFLSDFYLPSSMLAKILSWHGLAGYYQEVISSSDFLETKRTGKLYQRLLAKTSLSEDSIVMIGDNIDSDGRMAAHAGLKSICLDRTRQNARYAILTRSFSKPQKVYRQLDALFEKKNIFPELSITLYNFIRKLHKKLLIDGVRDIFFFSREGQPLKRLFDIYQASIAAGGTIRIRSHYFLASRHSTFLPSLTSLDKETFHRLFRQYRAISLRDFLCSLGMEEYVNIITEQLLVDPDLRLSDFPTSKTFFQLRSLQQFRDVYEEKRQIQRRHFMEYLRGFDVNFSSKGLAFVDVGWKGSIQDNIYQITNKKYPITGYYLGLLALGDVSKNNKKTGVLFSSLPRPSKGFFVLRENTALFEVVLAANHGSASHYARVKGKIVPVLEEFIEDKYMYDQVIKPLLKEQENIFVKICAILSKYPIDDAWLDHYVIKKHARMVYFPRRKELEWFASIYHKENFGLLGNSEFCADDTITIKKRLGALCRLLMSPRTFLSDTFWPALKLNNNGIGLTIRPYNGWRILRQIQKGNF